MEKAELLELLACEAMTLAEVKEKHPALHRAIEAASRDAASHLLRSVLPRSRAAIPRAMARVVAEVDRLDPRPESRGETLARLRDVVEASELDDAEKQIVRTRVAALEQLRPLEPAAPIDGERVGSVPFLTPLLAAARLHRVGDLAAISARKMAKLQEQVEDIAALDREELGRLASENVISEEEKAKLGLAANLLALCDGEDRMATALLERGDIRHLRDLVGLDERAWQKLVDDHGFSPGEGRARDLAARVAALFPSAAFASRLPEVDAAKLADEIEVAERTGHAERVERARAEVARGRDSMKEPDVPKLMCRCGVLIPYSEIPSPNEWLIISDRDFDAFSGQVDAEEVYRVMKSVLKCPSCGRLWIFWDGFSADPQEYQPAGNVEEP